MISSRTSVPKETSNNYKLWDKKIVTPKYNTLIKSTKTVTAILSLLVIVLARYFLVTSPVAFQKSVAIKFVNKSQLMLPEPKSYIDIQQILHKIPYKDYGGMVYEIQPQQKYSQTIKNGYGNCSNLVFGLAYHLRQRNHEYQIVHLLPPDGFLNGDGHTVINTPYVINGKNSYGIVDVHEGGLPQDNDLLIDLNSLRNANFSNPSILSLNPNKDEQSPYYGEFLDNSIVGIIKSEEVDVYFNFIDKIYVPLGNKKIEKMLYDGLSVVFGYYPNIYVVQEDYFVLFEGNKATKILAHVLLISIRSLLLLLVFLVTILLLYRFGSGLLELRLIQNNIG